MIIKSFRESYIPKKTLKTCYRHYEFLIMSFGLTNTPATYMDRINRVLITNLDMFVIVFIEDI